MHKHREVIQLLVGYFLSIGVPAVSTRVDYGRIEVLCTKSSCSISTGSLEGRFKGSDTSLRKCSFCADNAVFRTLANAKHYSGLKPFVSNVAKALPER